MRRLTVNADWLLLIYALVVGWLCLYVPWSGRGRYGEDLGYWFVWNPPKRPASIDLSRLGLELVAATAALVVLAMWREWRSQRRLTARPSSPPPGWWLRGEWLRGEPLFLYPVVAVVVSLALVVAWIRAALWRLWRLFSGGR